MIDDVGDTGDGDRRSLWTQAIESVYMNIHMYIYIYTYVHYMIILMITNMTLCIHIYGCVYIHIYI